MDPRTTARRIAVLVESNTTGTGRLFAQTLREEGLEPVLLSDRPERYAYAAEDGLEVLTVDTQSDDAIAEACAALGRRSGLAGVLTSSDYYVAAAARAAARFGLPGKDAGAVARAQDKRVQRERCAAAEVACPRFRAVETTEEAETAVEAVGFPAVVKPVTGSGSVNVRLCRTTAEVLAQLDAIFANTHNERGQPIPRAALVEERIEGREVSVEIFDGRAVCVIDKRLGEAPHFLEVGHDVPSSLPAHDLETARAAAERAVSALGVGQGPCHVELRIARGTPFLIEVNVRLAGGFLPELVRLATGVDLTRATVRAACGLAPELRPSRSHFAAIRFLVPRRSGVLARIRGAAEARAVPGVSDVQIYRGTGLNFTLRGDFRDRMGHVIAEASDRAVCARALDDALARICLDLEEAA
jgi:biotin carboxylase